MNCTPATLHFVEFLVHGASDYQLEDVLYEISNDQLHCIREMLHNLQQHFGKGWIKNYVNQAKLNKTEPRPYSIKKCQTFVHQLLKRQASRARLRNYRRLVKYGLTLALKKFRKTLTMRNFSTRTLQTHPRSTSKSDDELSETADDIDGDDGTDMDGQDDGSSDSADMGQEESELLKPQSKTKKRQTKTPTSQKKKTLTKKKKVTSVSFKRNNPREADDSDITDALENDSQPEDSDASE
jgi:hypothetical protein